MEVVPIVVSVPWFSHDRFYFITNSFTLGQVVFQDRSLFNRTVVASRPQQTSLILASSARKGLFFENGVQPPLDITVDPEITEPAREFLKIYWNLFPNSFL